MLGKKLSELFLMLFLFLVFPVLVQSELSTTTHCPNMKTSLRLIRKRRHLVFPEGSSLVVFWIPLFLVSVFTTLPSAYLQCYYNILSLSFLTASSVKAFMTHAPAGWFFVMELDLVYPLPNHNFTASHLRQKLHHRQKKELWDKLRDGLDYHNLKGSACILRSICDAKKYLAPPGRSLVHDLLRAVFTAPLDDEDFVEEVQSSYSELMDPGACDQDIDCPFSPVLFILSLNKQKY